MARDFVPDVQEIHDKLKALVAGEISREEATRWAARQIAASEDVDIEDHVWTALDQLDGCDLLVQPNQYLHSADDLEDWLNQFELAIADTTRDPSGQTGQAQSKESG